MAIDREDRWVLIGWGSFVLLLFAGSMLVLL